MERHKGKNVFWIEQKYEGKMYEVYIFLYKSSGVKIINLSVYSEKSPKSPAQVTDIQTG